MANIIFHPYRTVQNIDECAICLNNNTPWTSVSHPGGETYHAFHYDCIQTSLRNRNVCPLCEQGVARVNPPPTSSLEYFIQELRNTPIDFLNAIKRWPIRVNQTLIAGYKSANHYYTQIEQGIKSGYNSGHEIVCRAVNSAYNSTIEGLNQAKQVINTGYNSALECLSQANQKMNSGYNSALQGLGQIKQTMNSTWAWTIAQATRAKTALEEWSKSVEPSPSETIIDASTLTPQKVIDAALLAPKKVVDAALLAPQRVIDASTLVPKKRIKKTDTASFIQQRKNP